MVLRISYSGQKPMLVVSFDLIPIMCGNALCTHDERTKILPYPFPHHLHFSCSQSVVLYAQRYAQTLQGFLI